MILAMLGSYVLVEFVGGCLSMCVAHRASIRIPVLPPVQNIRRVGGTHRVGAVHAAAYLGAVPNTVRQDIKIQC